MIAPRAVFVLALISIVFPVAAAGRATIDAPARDLRICVDPDNPPLSMNRVAAQPGVDVDVGQAIAERLDLLPRLVWVDTTYGGRALRRSLLAGQCDVFMTSTSGWNCRARRTACRPFAASPTTLMSDWASSRTRSPSRTTVWSSASRTLIMAHHSSTSG